jgi:osmotically-inducible protein OsmY
MVIRHVMANRLLPAVTLGAAIFAAMAAVAGPAEPTNELDKGIVVTARRPQDAALAASVTSAIEEDPYIFAEHVSVTVENGVVRLTGVVQDLPELFAILRHARKVAGRGRVVDEIIFQPIDVDGN